MRPPARANGGDQLPARETEPLTQTDIVRFAGAGGDFNPLHHDPEFARKAGFEQVISMGQLQAGLLAAWLTDWCGVEHLRELSVRFTAPVTLGDVLRFAGVVLDVREVDGTSLARLELAVLRGDVPVVTGTAEVIVTAE